MKLLALRLANWTLRFVTGDRFDLLIDPDDGTVWLGRYVKSVNVSHGDLKYADRDRDRCCIGMLALNGKAVNLRVTKRERDLTARAETIRSKIYG